MLRNTSIYINNTYNIIVSSMLELMKEYIPTPFLLMRNRTSQSVLKQNAEK